MILKNETGESLVQVLSERELKETNGGMAQIAGAGALAAGCGLVLGALIVGAAIGVGLYYGTKWILSK